MAKGSKIVLVLLESLAGTGHKIARPRWKTSDKMEMMHYDPWVQQWVLYRERLKIKSLNW